jgi:uncharacterized membrane protein YfcA
LLIYLPIAELPVSMFTILAMGAAVGFISGLFGVGGGFLIVPLLTLWIGLAFRRAVATSLVIITLTGTAALASHLAEGAELDVPVTLLLAGSTAAGAVLGTSVGGQVPQRLLARGFAVVVFLVAAFLLVNTLAFEGPPTG